MTELERLLIEQLNKLSESYEQQLSELREQQLQQSTALHELSQRVEQLTRLLQE